MRTYHGLQQPPRSPREGQAISIDPTLEALAADTRPQLAGIPGWDW